MKSPKDYYKSAKYAYKEFFSIFPTELDFLHHVFFVLGNGYEWEDGFPRCYIMSRKEHVGMYKEMGFSADDFKPTISFEEWLKAKPQQRELYPLCDLTFALETPKNIDPIWKEKLIQALDWAETLESYEWRDEDYKVIGNNKEKDHQILSRIREILKEIK